MNREIGGRPYNEKSFKRLAGTSITMNIVYSDEIGINRLWALLPSWRIFEEKKVNLDIGYDRIHLTGLAYQALHNKNQFLLSPYTKAIDRRIYMG